MSKEEIKKIIIRYLSENGAESISIFGSFVEQNSNDFNDIDLIVQFRKHKGLLEIVKIERELSNMAGVKIDLQTEKSISPYISEKINSSKVKLL